MLFIHIPASSTGYTLTVILCAIVAQNLFDQIVYPRVVGASVGLHPVVSIFALMAGATLCGVLGMLIAVPVAASIQIVLMYFFPKLTQPPPKHLLESPPPLA
jgi:predicted PurR-regulated permease PerM